jgi:2-dehydro-3-deoxyphosphogluconate aldolase/(4S)-4-hydroxy-2-oxoglutarate aldolase
MTISRNIHSNVSCIGGTWITPGDLLASRDYKTIAKIAVEAAALGG